MTPALLVPAALAALIALALPLLIHLARRSETRPTDFAALRWLRQKPKPRSRIRFDERLLLALRLLLITAVALWLARPVLFGSASKDGWAMVAPGADLAQVRAAAGSDTKLRWLQPGFPEVDAPPVTGRLPVASLLRQLDAERPAGAEITVFVPSILEGADAERPRLSRPVAWRILPARSSRAKSRDVAPRVSTSLDTNGRGVVLRYGTGREPGLRYIRAALIALQAPFAAASASEPLPARADKLVWLAPGPLPQRIVDWIGQGGTALLAADTAYDWPSAPIAYWRDDLGAPIVEGAVLGKGRVRRFTRPLLPSAMPQLLDPDVPDRLHALFAAPAPAPSRVDARAYAPLTGGASYPQPAREVRPWLTLLVALLLIAERWLATRRTRGIAP